MGPHLENDTFENRANSGVDANLRMEAINEKANSVVGNATDFHVDLRSSMIDDIEIARALHGVLSPTGSAGSPS